MLRAVLFARDGISRAAPRGAMCLSRTQPAAAVPLVAVGHLGTRRATVHPDRRSRRGLIDLKNDTVSDPSAGPAKKDRLMPLAEYFAAKDKVNRLGVLVGFGGGLGGFLGSVSLAQIYFGHLLGNQYTNPPIPADLIWGVQADIVLPAACMASAFVSFGVTRVLSRKVWELMNRTESARIDDRARDIYLRVEKFRTTGDDAQDDYYGSSIRSAKTYLLWLRKQKARREELAGLDP